MTITPYSNFISNFKKALEQHLTTNNLFIQKNNNNYEIASMCWSFGTYSLNQSEQDFNHYIINLEQSFIKGNDDFSLKLEIKSNSMTNIKCKDITFKERVMLLYRDSNNLNNEQFMHCFHKLFPYDSLDQEIGFYEFISIPHHEVGTYQAKPDYSIEKLKEKILLIVENWHIPFTKLEHINESLMIFNSFNFKNQSSQAAKALQNVLSLIPENYRDSKTVDTWVVRFCDKNLDSKDIYPFLSYLPDDYLKYDKKEGTLLDVYANTVTKLEINLANLIDKHPTIKKTAQLTDMLEFLPVLKQSSVLDIEDLHFVRKDNVYSIFVESNNNNAINSTLFTYYFESCIDYIVNQCEGLGEAQRNESLTKYLTYLDMDQKLPDKGISTIKKKKI